MILNLVALEMKREIYLDFNVMIDFISKRNLDIVRKVSSFQAESIYPYSPAHIEEVANIARNKRVSSEDGIKYTIENLNGISDLSNNHEYLPSEGNGIVLKIEDPASCYERVVKGFKETLYVEKIQEYRLGNKINSGNMISDVSKIKAQQLFENEKVLCEFNEYCTKHDFKNHSFKYKKNDFQHNEKTIEILFNFLEVIGFYEDKPDKFRSNVHDNTHIIYASQANYFVTGDTRTKAKAEAIYSFMGIETKVLDRNGFLNLD